MIRLWRETILSQDTPVARYLRRRGITMSLPRTLRCHPNLRHAPSGQRFPAMIGAVVRSPEHCIVAIHRTYLTRDGRKAAVEPAKMSLGSIGGGAVQIGAPGPHLAIVEGLETALAVQQATGLPTWSALSAGGIRSLILPPLTLASVVTVAADDGPAGLKAARQAADRWSRSGRTVRIAVSSEGTDFNDLLLRAQSRRR